MNSPRRESERRIRGGADVPVLCPERQLDPAVHRRRVAENSGDARVGGVVVGDAQLPVRIGLLRYRRDHRREVARIGVVHGDDQRDGRMACQPGDMLPDRDAVQVVQGVAALDPSLVSARTRTALFESEEDVMQQRVDAGSPNVGVRAEIEFAAEFRARVALRKTAVQQVVTGGIRGRREHLRVLSNVPFAVEQRRRANQFRVIVLGWARRAGGGLGAGPVTQHRRLGMDTRGSAPRRRRAQAAS